MKIIGNVKVLDCMVELECENCGWIESKVSRLHQGWTDVEDFKQIVSQESQCPICK